MAEEKKKTPKGIWNLYNVSGNKLERKNQSCPKCGAGTFLSAHNNRLTCGQCGYSEVKSVEKEAEVKSSEKKE